MVYVLHDDTDKVVFYLDDLWIGFFCPSRTVEPFGYETIAKSINEFSMTAGKYDVERISKFIFVCFNRKNVLRLSHIEQDDDLFAGYTNLGWASDFRIQEPRTRSIYKYQIPIQEDFTMELPKDAEIIRVACENGMFWMWALVDKNAPVEERFFKGFKTGSEIPEANLKYLGFCELYLQQNLAVYIFEDLRN